MKVAVKIALVSATCLGLTACDGGPPKGPDEFGVLPTKPLVIPDDTTILPEPNAQGRNLADQRPRVDGVVALGGRGERLDATGVTNSEAALIQAAGRKGVTANIRQITAEEDAEFRKRNKGKILERWVGSDVYSRRYRKQRLDEYAELLRLRKLGVKTPTAHPKGAN
jgi:hypothetical protein